MSVSQVFALVDDRDAPPALAVEDQDHLGSIRNKMQQPNAGSTRATSSSGYT